MAMHGIHSSNMHTEDQNSTPLVLVYDVGKMMYKCMSTYINERMKLPSMCYIKHAAFVSAGNNQKTY